LGWCWFLNVGRELLTPVASAPGPTVPVVGRPPGGRGWVSRGLRGRGAVGGGRLCRFLAGGRYGRRWHGVLRQSRKGGMSANPLVGLGHSFRGPGGHRGGGPAPPFGLGGGGHRHRSRPAFPTVGHSAGGGARRPDPGAGPWACKKWNLGIFQFFFRGPQGFDSRGGGPGAGTVLPRARLPAHAQDC